MNAINKLMLYRALAALSVLVMIGGGLFGSVALVLWVVGLFASSWLVATPFILMLAGAIGPGILYIPGRHADFGRRGMSAAHRLFLAALCAALMAGCATPADPVRDRIVEDSTAVREAQPAARRARAALDAGACVSADDRVILGKAWQHCTSLSETCESSYESALAAGEKKALDENAAAIAIGETVLSIKSAIYWIIGALGGIAAILTLIRFGGSIIGFVSKFTGRAGLLLLLAGVALATVPRATPAAVAVDPVQAKLVEVALRDRHSLATLRALITIESSWRPAAVNRRSGAAGLTQLKAATARGECGLRVDARVDERLDPIKNIDCGSAYLRKMRDRFGSLRGGLMGYFQGPGGFLRNGYTPGGRRYLAKFERAGGVL